MKKLLGWVALVIAVIWVIQNPDNAAATVHHIFHSLSTLASHL